MPPGVARSLLPALPGGVLGEERLHEHREVRLRYILPNVADFEPCLRIEIEVTARRRSGETGHAQVNGQHSRRDQNASGIRVIPART